MSLSCLKLQVWLLKNFLSLFLSLKIPESPHLLSLKCQEETPSSHLTSSHHVTIDIREGCLKRGCIACQKCVFVIRVRRQNKERHHYHHLNHHQHDSDVWHPKKVREEWVQTCFWWTEKLLFLSSKWSNWNENFLKLPSDSNVMSFTFLFLFQISSFCCCSSDLIFGWSFFLFISDHHYH